MHFLNEYIFLLIFLLLVKVLFNYTRSAVVSSSNFYVKRVFDGLICFDIVQTVFRDI
jgi:hypothetical protein